MNKRQKLKFMKWYEMQTEAIQHKNYNKYRTCFWWWTKNYVTDWNSPLWVIENHYFDKYRIRKWEKHENEKY